MNFKRAKIANLYLTDTQVDNIFITEYMPDAEGDFIKVYLTALMYADMEGMSNSLIAKHLGIAEEDVLRAWNYWESVGAIRKHYKDPEDRFHYSVEFVNLKEQLFSGDDSSRTESTGMLDGGLASEMDDAVVRETFDSVQEITGRLLDSKEMQAIVSWIYEDALEPALICYAYRFCGEKRGNNRFSYVSSVIREWEKESIKNIKDAEKYLGDTDLRHNQYKRVMKALGFYRNPTEDEKSKMDSWFDEMGFGIERVLEACAKTSGIANPNINYVHSILTNWSNGTTASSQSKSGGPGDAKGNAVTKVKQLYVEQRQKNEALREERKASVYKSIPRIKDIEDELRRASAEISRALLTGRTSSGMSADALRKRVTDLNGEKAFLLTEHNLPPDYLELHYDCDECKDTGVLENGERCQCFSEKLKLYI